MKNRFYNLSRDEFIALKKQFVHPSSEVSQPDQLVGRSEELKLARNAFERDGTNVFIWGKRGVGKTSLAHTAVNQYSERVYRGPTVACEADTTVNQLFQDVARRALEKNGSLSGKIKINLPPILTYEKDLGRVSVAVSSVNEASDLLTKVLPPKHEPHRNAVVIVDEFDQLKNRETLSFLTSLAKQMSVDASPVKFIFCGVAEDLDALIGHHESVGRYISAIQVNPLSDDKIWEIVNNIGEEFGIVRNRGHEIRIGQVACGYPTFAHLIMDELLTVAYENGVEDAEIPQEVFNDAMRRAAASAATHLQSSYTKATKKGTDKYVEVLWAVANGPHIMDRQFKDIYADYQRIMSLRRNREVILKEQLFRNHLNSLCKPSHGEVLQRSQSGWYHFTDPMFRGYVRMIAYNSEIELGDESFRA